jgi:hypothetical protein
MDNYEMTEKLVEKTGVSFAEAKEALEKTNWDMLDAVILLEKEGKTAKKSASYSTNAAPSPELVPAPCHSECKKKAKGFWQTIKNFLTKNKLILKDKFGSEIFSIPVWLAIAVFIIAFWLVIISMVLAFIFGYRISFMGPDLGSESINGAIDKAASAAESFVNEVKERHTESNEAK